MAKTKSKKFHKIRVHHNRWLIWAIAYLLFVAIAMVGYVKVSDLSLDSENTSLNSVLAHTFTDSKHGFTVKYPANWSIESNIDSMTFLPYDSSDNGVTVSVVSPAAEKAIRSSLEISYETKTTVDSSTASKIINDLGSGRGEMVVLINHDKQVFVIRGSTNFVEKFLTTFHFLKP